MRQPNRILSLILIPILVGVLGGAQWAPHLEALRAPVAQAQVQMQRLPGTFEMLPSGRGAYGATALLTDAGGNTFYAYKNELEANANITWVQVVRVSPSGLTTGSWQVRPLADYKLDGVGLFHSGPDLLISGTTHSYVGSRARDVEVGKIPGVFDYQPGIESQRGGPGAFVPGSQPEPSSCPTIEELRAMVREENERLLGQLRLEISGSSTGSIRQGLEDKAKDALREERVITEGMYGGAQGSHIIYQQEVNTSYTGALGAATKIALSATQTATAQRSPTP